MTLLANLSCLKSKAITMDVGDEQMLQKLETAQMKLSMAQRPRDERNVQGVVDGIFTARQQLERLSLILQEMWAEIIQNVSQFETPSIKFVLTRLVRRWRRRFRTIWTQRRNAKSKQHE